MADNTEPSTEDSANADTTDAVNDATTAVSSLSVQDNQAAVVDDVAEETQILVEDVQENDENADELPPHAQIRQEFLSLLPPPVHPRLAHLKTLHEQREKLLEHYLVERAALEQKYSELMKPLFEERRAVVAGELDAKISEKESKIVGEVPEDEEPVVQGGGEDNVKGIPQFWACAMGNMDVLAELITEGKSLWVVCICKSVYLYFMQGWEFVWCWSCNFVLLFVSLNAWFWES